MDTKNDIKEASEAIWSKVLTQVSIEQIDRIVDRGDGSSLLSGVLHLAQAACRSNDDAVFVTMSKLEKLAEGTKATACVLMMHLWPIADIQFMHEVCNAIDLWIWDCDSPKLTEQLRSMAESEEDPRKRRHYESAANRGSERRPG